VERGRCLRALGLQVAVIEDDEDLSRGDRIAFVDGELYNAAEHLGADGDPVGVDVGVVARDVAAEVDVPVPSPPHRGKKQQCERDDDAAFPEHRHLVDALVPV
jgi:hypothetical protein